MVRELGAPEVCNYMRGKGDKWKAVYMPNKTAIIPSGYYCSHNWLHMSMALTAPTSMTAPEAVYGSTESLSFLIGLGSFLFHSLFWERLQRCQRIDITQWEIEDGTVACKIGFTQDMP